VSAEDQGGLIGFEFQAWICRFYALPPAGLAADELRSNCRLASQGLSSDAIRILGIPSLPTENDANGHQKDTKKSRSTTRRPAFFWFGYKRREIPTSSPAPRC
jgi:hypothetical protein